MSLTFNPNTFTAGYSMLNGDIQMGGDLYTAVLLSLFTWATAQEGDLPPGRDKQGWWADSYSSIPGDVTGSRLYLLRNAKLTIDTVNRAKQYAQEALQWMIDDGVCSDVVVIAERAGINQLSMSVSIYKNDGSKVVFDFNNIWAYVGL